MPGVPPCSPPTSVTNLTPRSPTSPSSSAAPPWPPLVVRSAPSGAVYADLPPGDYEVCLAKPGFGSKRIRAALGGPPVHFRLLSDRLLGYAWPKWCRAGDAVQFRVHSVEPYKLLLYRYGLDKELVRNVGWYDNHGPRAAMQTLPDGHFVETGVKLEQRLRRPPAARHGARARTGLYYFHARGESGAFFSFPLVVAPATAAAGDRGAGLDQHLERLQPLRRPQQLRPRRRA